MSSGGFIYAIGIEGMACVKIGKTAGSVEKRLMMLQTGQPALLILLASVPVNKDIHRIEKAIHHFLATDRQRGEWFAVAINQGQLEALILRAMESLAEETPPHIEERELQHAPDSVGKRIKQLRQARGMAQGQLAGATGLPQSLLSQIENGVRRGSHMQIGVASRIACALHVSLDALAGTPWDDIDSEDCPSIY
jgi:DNA-binding XRE family transcriptional regulator